MGRKRPPNAKTERVQFGWRVHAKVRTKKKQWFTKQQKHEVIEVLVPKPISINFLSKGAAEAFAAIAAKDARYESVWVSENFGDEVQ